MESSSPEGLADWMAAATRLEIDMGCARGKFLVAMAERYPERHFLGVEWQADRVKRTGNKIARLGIPNARVEQGEGLVAVKQWFPPASVDVIHVLFPDPWPKRRHHVRRLVQAEFFAAVRPALKPGGRLRFRTDDRPYFEAVSALAVTLPDWRLVADEPDDAFPLTEFEQRFVEEGLPIYSVVFTPSEIASS